MSAQKSKKTAEQARSGRRRLPILGTHEKTKSASSTEIAAVTSSAPVEQAQRIAAGVLTTAQVTSTVSITCPENKAIDHGLRLGALGLLAEFAPADAVESTLAPLIVALRNSVMDSLGLATKALPERRDLELNIAIKGLGAIAELVRVYDAHRGHGNRRVSVGNVNVEPGAQAIVGNVENQAPRNEPATEPASVAPRKLTARAG